MNSIKSVKKIFAILTVIFVYTVLANNLYAQDDSKKYSEKDMPQAVMESFKKSYPNAEILGFNAGKENGTQIYEIETKDGNVYRDLEYTADGKISEIGEIIEISSLPEAVLNSLRSNFKSAKITEAEKKTGNSGITYEVIIEQNKEKYEVLLSESGKVLKKSEEEDGSDDSKESDDDN